MIKIPANFFSRSLNAHAWLGLFVGALMYLICLSGTIAVYFEELERWEQPSVVESQSYNIDTIDMAFNKLLSDGSVAVTPHMYITLPTQGNPRVGLITENEGWFLNQDGSIASPTAHPWTDVLTELHLFLHLPKSWGMIFVSVLGVLLLALIISGFASHRTIFKDAFKLRLFGNKQLQQTDMHNRLSVWAAPFHIMIAITGAFFGLATVVLYAYAFTFADNDVDFVIAKVFGEEPELHQAIDRIEIAKAFKQMPELAPATKPILAIVHDTGTPEQFIEIYSYYPNRLIYSDNFVFNANGKFLHRQGFSDGAIGKQIVYSMYRLHFGHFDGWWVKVLYFVLGLALTIVSVSGVNLWLVKRKKYDAINYCWPGFVWGAPLSLLILAVSHFAIGYVENYMFWLVMTLAVVYSFRKKDELKARANLQFLTGLTGFLLVIVYAIRFEAAVLSTISLSINSAIVVGSLIMILGCWRSYKV